MDSFLKKDINIQRDNPLKIWMLHQGKIKVLPEQMSTYRRNSGGISENTNIEAIYKAELATASALGKELDGFYLKSLFIKSHWHRYYLTNCKGLSFYDRLSLFMKFLVPSFYDFPRNLRNVLSAFYHIFVS